MKQALIYSPYLDTLGGGEVYSLHFAQALTKHHYQVHLAWPDHSIIKHAQKNLNLDISKFHIDPQAHQIFQSGGVVKKFFLTKKYDLSFFVSDGSLPFLFSQNNIVHFQVPFTHLRPTLRSKLKLQTINHIVCNSQFTQKIINAKLATKSKVLYPPINFQVKPGPKKNQILSVGRFTDALHNKRQDILVQAFKNLVDAGLKNWTLVLAGGSHEGGNFLQNLIEEAKGYPIKIKTDISGNKLKKLYATSKIFWLATGYGIDQNKHPQKVEHFGISTVEAMIAGAVPIVINKGGQPEIVHHGQNGYLFDDITKLQQLSQKLIQSPKKLKQLSQAAQTIQSKFSGQIFVNQVKKFLYL